MNQQHFVNIRGVNVSFPYEPYDVQMDYMNCTIEACQEGKFAMLESPTGTGKTLSLLCSALSWKESQGQLSQIVYSSRTHSQLSNVIKELKKTHFKPSVVHIASRKVLCINQYIRHYDNYLLTRLCHDLKAKKNCPYATDENLNKYAADVLLPRTDIEDYIQVCVSKKICPYYAAQINSDKADLILAPYSYIVDSNVRSFLPVSALTNNILIFDEAHNFADECSSNMSADLLFSSLGAAYLAIDKIKPNEFEMAGKLLTTKLTANDLVSTKLVIKGLNEYYSNLASNNPEFSAIVEKAEAMRGKQTFVVKKTIVELYETFENVGIYEANVGMINNVLDAIIAKGLDLGILNNEFGHIYAILKFLQLIFPENHKDVPLFSKYFSICYTSDFSISVICFSPKIGFDKLTAFLPKSIILTSGTLSPLKSLEEELGRIFPIKLECNHIINTEQVLVAIANTGPNDVRMNFTFQNRKGNKNLTKELAEAVASTYNVIPGGSLVFFPSFVFLDEVSQLIKKEGSRKKTIYIEPRDSLMQATVLQNYKRDVKKGASLLAVCRGKMSEGLDFTDELARSVCVVGIPFPNISDFKVDLKKQWLEKRTPGWGQRWYNECAMKAVNQSIGRAIRHKDDYAVIILLDERYGSFRSMLSHWVQDSIHVYDNFQTLLDETAYFFKLRESGLFSMKTGKRITQFKGESSRLIHDDFPMDVPTIEKEEIVKKEVEFVPPTIVHLKTKEKKPEKIKPTMRSLSSLLGAQSQPKKEAPKNGLFGLIGLNTKPKSKSLEMSHSYDDIRKGKKEKEQSEEFKFCIVCKKKEELRKLKCGHYICNKCRGFFEMVKMPCPLCKKEKSG